MPGPSSRVAQQQRADHRVPREHDGHQDEWRTAAVGVGKSDGTERRDRGATHAGTEDADGQAAAGGRAGGNQAFTNGTPTANAVPPIPRKKPPTISRTNDVPANPTNSTGTMVNALTVGNMMRAPTRSVSAPTGMRPSDPTTTGTAATSACWNDESRSSSR